MPLSNSLVMPSLKDACYGMTEVKYERFYLKEEKCC